MKRKIFALVLLLCMLLPLGQALALVDQSQWESFMQEELQNVVTMVAQSGKAPVTRPFIGDYDVNKDAFIDKTEVKNIQKFLDSRE